MSLILTDKACIELRFWLKLVQGVFVGGAIALAAVLVSAATLDHPAHILLWCCLTGYVVCHYFLSLIP